MKSVKGFQFSGIHSGIKKENKDLALIYAPDGASFASVTTTNKFAAPGVHYTRAITKNETLLKAILVNSGNANALTGERGTQDILTLLRTLGEHINVKPTQGLALSTGIIGKFLPVGIMQEAMLKLTQSLTDNPESFATAIMTTDLVPKIVYHQWESEGETFSILGIAKGSGMIQPNMATMFSFILTDATIDSSTLRQMIPDIADKSFNAISVDGDASTNDSFLLLASNKKAQITAKNLADFQTELTNVAIQLSQKIVRDGEGATKFVEVRILCAKTVSEARKMFQAIATSPLVKTAWFGQNPNFGRILCTIGKLDTSLDPEIVDLQLGPHYVVKQGAAVDTPKSLLDTYMQQPDLCITVTLHQGDACFTGWTTDLSYDYVKINAEYN